MGKRKADITSPEWSHMLEVDSITDGMKLTIAPDEQERAALSQRIGVISLDSLSADITVHQPTGNAVIHVEGKLKAKVTQKCVVTLEPIETDIQEGFEAWFADSESTVSFAKARQERLLQKGHAEIPILKENEDPEPVIDGKIDLGELVTQYLLLAINPYPHAEGAHYEKGDDTESREPSDMRKNPFAALKNWKDRMGGGDS